jgi:hypothetical protein
VLDGNPSEFFCEFPYDEYVEALRLPRDLIAPLTLLAWLKYIRNESRRSHFLAKLHWVDRNVIPVLQLLEESLDKIE